MKLTYFADDNGKKITNKNWSQLSRLSLEEVSQFVGASSITTHIHSSNYKFEGVYPLMKIDFYYKKAFIKIEIDFKNNKIFSLWIENADRGNDTMYKVINVQAKTAKAAKVKSLVGDAHGGPEANCPAYSLLGRFGFLMCDEDQEKFLSQMKTDKRSEKSLFELLKTSAGRKYWKKQGWNWTGYFCLQTNESFDIINSYRAVNHPD